MKTDYKFNIIKTGGGKTTATVVFYEGQDNSVGVYVRSSVLKTETYTYNTEKTYDELVALMNMELATDTIRTAITEQT